MSISILLLLFVFLLISSMLMIYTSHKTTLQMQKEMNNKVINQLFYNINYMNEITQNLMLSLYFNNDVISLMNSREIEIYELYPKLDELRKIVNTYSFVDSIVIYNNNNKCYYSTNYKTSCHEDGVNQEIDRYIKNIGTIPKLKLVPIMKDNNKSIKDDRLDYFSMFFYGAYDTSVQASTIIINIKPEWLFDNVNSLNHLIKYEGSSILLMDSNYSFLNKQNESDQQLNQLEKLMKSQDNKKEGTFIAKIDKKKKLISYKKSTNNDWTIINILPYDKVMTNVNQLQNMMIVVTVCILIVAMIVALVLAYNLYKPILTIMNKITNSSHTEHSVGLIDELAYMNNHFMSISENIARLKKDNQSNKNIIKNYLLRKFIINSSKSELSELKEQQKHLNLQIHFESKLLLCILTIDNYHSYIETYSDEEQKENEFIIVNIAHEIVSNNFKNEIFHMRNNHFVMVINMNLDGNDNEIIMEKFREIQQTINQIFGISISATVSGPIEHYEHLAKSYSKTYDYSMYRLIHGHGKIITPEMVEENVNNFDCLFPVETERKFIEGIKTNDRHIVDEQLDGLFSYMKHLSYHNIIYFLTHIIAVIQRVIMEINQNTIHPITVDLKLYDRNLLDLETLDEIYEMINRLLDEVIEHRKSIVNMDTNDLIVNTIKEIVGENYKDMNLSLKGISDMLRLSPTHANRIFKQKESLSIGEYIKEVRLNCSIELLIKKKYTVNEIMDEVGFGNQSYFFRVFKKKFGTTPKEYQRSKLLRDL